MPHDARVMILARGVTLYTLKFWLTHYNQGPIWLYFDIIYFIVLQQLLYTSNLILWKK